MVPFGSPVVPEVNAIRETSSAAVSQAVNLSKPGFITRVSSASGAPLPQSNTYSGRRTGKWHVLLWGSGAPDALETLMMKPGYEKFTACDTAADDVCLIAFTSGTTGEPKGTMHFHRDMLAICDSYAKHVLQAEPTDRFTGSPPLAFTFGLGGLVLFPLRIGASTVLLEKAGPDELLDAIAKYKITIPFTAPTAYRAMLGKLKDHDVSSLRKCVSAGETLPKATFDAWHAATGIKILDGIGATEMLHIFIGSPEHEVRAGSTGKPVPGYEARILDDDGNDAPPGTVGRLAVRGPTGCRYLADDRQKKYVQDGWNVTGDTYLMDADGYFWYQARSDDMIISAGYNIAGPEVESALLTHAAVAECGVVGCPDEERGQIVKAYVVLRAGMTGDAAMTKALAGPRQGDGRALQISARHRIRHRAAEDADRKTAALRVAPPRRRRRVAQARIIRRDARAGPNRSATAVALDQARNAAAARLAGAERLRQRHQGARRVRVRRRHGRLGREGEIPEGLCRAGEAGVGKHPRGSGRRQRAARAYRSPDLVCPRHGRISRLPPRARRGLSRGAGRSFPGDGAGAGRPAVRARGAARDRSDGGGAVDTATYALSHPRRQEDGRAEAIAERGRVGCCALLRDPPGRSLSLRVHPPPAGEG